MDTLVGLGGLVFENVDFLLEEKHFSHPFLFWLFLSLAGDGMVVWLRDRDALEVGGFV